MKSTTLFPFFSLLLSAFFLQQASAEELDLPTPAPWPSPQHIEVYIHEPSKVAPENVHEEGSNELEDLEELKELEEDQELTALKTPQTSEDPFPLAADLGLSADLMLIRPRPAALLTTTRSEISPRLNLKVTEDLSFTLRVNFLDGGVDRHAGGSSPKGEILTEQAFLRWTIESWSSKIYSYQVERGLKVGLQLLPIGLINPQSLPDSYMTVVPPEVETYIIPRRWSEMGAVYEAQHQQLGAGFTYRLGLFNSLDAGKLRPDSYLSRGVQGGNGKAQDPSLIAGLEFQDENFRFGGSYLYGHTGHSLEGLGFSPLHLYEVHLKAGLGRLSFTGLFAEAHLLDAEAIQVVNNTSTFGKKARGYYLNLALDLLHNSSHRSWPLFVRFEHYNLHYEVPPGESSDPLLKRTNINYGMNYSPHPQLIFKFDYQDRKNALEPEPGIFSLGLSFIY